MAELKDTWDLTHMFESVQAWRDGMDEARTMADELAAMQGTITKDADTLYLALKRNDKLGEKLTALFVYAKMYFEQNIFPPQTNPLNQQNIISTKNQLQSSNQLEDDEE